jgi:Rieske Fe-S protein
MSLPWPSTEAAMRARNGARPLAGGVTMAQCETCGNDYDKAFAISIAGKSHTFDSFECAIQALAPTCNHCGCRILGHGVEAEGAIYCCAHCAGQKGVTAVRDRV